MSVTDNDKTMLCTGERDINSGLLIHEAHLLSSIRADQGEDDERALLALDGVDIADHHVLVLAEAPLEELPLPFIRGDDRDIRLSSTVREELVDNFADC